MISHSIPSPRALLLIGAAAATLSCNSHTEPSPVPIAVTVREFNIGLDHASAPRGVVIFSVHNTGEDHHEFLVIKTDLAPGNLPTEDDGSYHENGAGTQLLDEIEDVGPGETKELRIRLDPGHHVLICNMVQIEDDGSVEVHYMEGMRVQFNVE